jgi:hypothetical protein
MGQQPIGVAQRRGHQGSQRLGNIGTGHFGQMIAAAPSEAMVIVS